jgi:Methyltransferase domain
LSARAWAGIADQVVGVEPNAAMRAFAARASNETNVRYVDASSYATGLRPESVDIVTAAQSISGCVRKTYSVKSGGSCGPAFSVGEACAVQAFVEFVSEPIELRASAFAGVFLCVEQAHP